MKETKFKDREIGRIPEEAIRNSSVKVPPKNTLLMAMYDGTIGKLGIIKNSSATNQACCAIIPKEDEMKFIFYKLLIDRTTLVSKGWGAGQPNISQTIIKGLKYSFPFKNEQQRIAAALTSMDDEITAFETTRAKYEAVKQGMMQQLLTGNIRLVS